MVERLPPIYVFNTINDNNFQMFRNQKIKCKRLKLAEDTSTFNLKY